MNLFAFCALIALAVSEFVFGTATPVSQYCSFPFYSWFGDNTSNTHLAVVCYAIAIVLLLVAGNMAYFSIALVLLGLLLAMVALSRHPCTSLPGSISSTAVAWSYRTLAVLVHMTGLWMLPVCILWSLAGAYTDDQFFVYEIGHFVPASFYLLGLVILPLLLLPGSCPLGGTEHQKLEGKFIFISGIIYFCIFRTAHHFLGESMTTGMSA